MGGLPGHLADVSIDDWDVLLCAVKDRLRLTVGESLTQPINGSAIPVRASVLECVEALDQLHDTLKHVLATNRPIDTGYTHDVRSSGPETRLMAPAGGPGAAPP